MTNNEIKNFSEDAPIATSISPWLSVRNSVKAVEFYKTAFGAIEVYRLEDPDGGSVRMILTVMYPDDIFISALKAGASQVFPVGEEHGWRLGRLVDPFGHRWEIGRPLS